MLSIKQLYSKFFSTNKEKIETDNHINFDKDSVVMTIGLTPDYEIDLSIEIKDLHIKDKADLQIKTQKIASFFYTVTSGGLNKTIIEFLVEILSDKDNKEMFESVLYNWLLLEQNETNNKKSANKTLPLIEPSKVFVPYFNNK